jgi:glucokinase
MIGVLDIGGTKIAAGMVDRQGRLLAHTESPTQLKKNFADSLAQMVSMLRQTARQAGELIEGIGVGCTGPVNPQTGMLGEIEFMPDWNGVNLAQALVHALDVPVAIENDADAAALGEWTWGAGRGTNLFLLVTVGTGIGAGLVLNGELYRGVNGAHPEIGHHIIDPSGPQCFCGGRGCWESLASGPAMQRWAQASDPHPPAPAGHSPGAPEGVPRSGFGCSETSQAGWTSARQVCQAAQDGHPLAQAAVQRTALYLGLGLANLVTLFTPEVIALGGGLMQSLPLFLPTIQHTIRSTCGLVPHEEVKVIPAALGSRAGLIGAARVWYNRYERG